MADKTLNVLKEQIRLLITIKKTQRELKDNEKEMLRTLRAEHKFRKEMNEGSRAEVADRKSIYDTTLNSTNLEKKLVGLLQKGGIYREITAESFSKQLEINKQIAMGNLENVDLESQLADIADLKFIIADNLWGVNKKLADELINKIIPALETEVDLSRKLIDTAEVRQEIAEKNNKLYEEAFGWWENIKKKVDKAGQAMATPQGRLLLMKGLALGIVVALGVMVKKMFDFANETGFSYAQMTKFGLATVYARDELTAILDNFGSLDNVTTDTLINMKLLSLQYGVSADASAKLAIQMMSISGMSAEAAFSSMRITSELARANGVAPQAVLEDIANNAEFFAQFAKEGGSNLAKAAVQARKLGLSLDTTAKIADGLLNFESSIESQMEASVLLGRNINLDQARRLAFAGDMVGLQREVLSVVGSQSELEGMNVIQRKALAGAIGVEVSELTKMVMNQDKLTTGATLQNQISTQGNQILSAMGDNWLKIIVGITSVGAAITLLIKSGLFGKGGFFGKLNETISDTSKTVGNVARNLGRGFVSIMKSLGDGFSSFAKGIGSGIVSLLSALGRGIVGLLTPLSVLANPATIIGITVFTGAMIGLGYAFKLFGEGLDSAVPAIIELSSIPVAQLMGLAVAFGALGLSMIPLSLGMAALAVSSLALLPLLPVLKSVSGMGNISTVSMSTTSGDTSSSTDMVETNTLLTKLVETNSKLLEQNDKLMTKLTRTVSEMGVA